MTLIQHQPRKIPNPQQFLQRKLNGFDKRQAYLKSIRGRVLEQDADLDEAIEIAQLEYDERYHEIDDELRKAEDNTALNGIIRALLTNLNEFQEYFSNTVSETPFNELNDDDLAEAIEDLNEEYSEHINVS